MQSTPATNTLRTPTVAAAIVVWLVYTAVTIAVQASSGIPYADWFRTASNAWRTGVLSLVAGAMLLVAFQVAARWDHLWRDPVRLPVSRLMQVALLVWWLLIAVRLLGVRWRDVPLDLLAAVVASGVLVGFAEETLFRGIVLRGLRAGGRAESQAAVWTALAFGLFHLPNVFMGTGAVGLLQVVLAATSGVVLYVFRRSFGRLWPAMVAHGAWDISTFLAGSHAAPWLEPWTLASLLLMPLLGLAILVSLYRHDRHTVALPAA